MSKQGGMKSAFKKKYRWIYHHFFLFHQKALHLAMMQFNKKCKFTRTLSTATSVAWVSQVFCSGHLINDFDPSFLFQHVEGFWTMSFVLYNSSNDRWLDHYHTNVSQDCSPSPDPVAQRFKDISLFSTINYIYSSSFLCNDLVLSSCTTFLANMYRYIFFHIYYFMSYILPPTLAYCS